MGKLPDPRKVRRDTVIWTVLVLTIYLALAMYMIGFNHGMRYAS